MPASSKLLVGDQFNRPAPQYYNPVTDQYEYLHGSDGALHAKLISGTAIAAELSVSQRDIVARAIDEIINTIGLENIACFLPMWENTGTELRDLINPDLRFRVVGATPGVAGPFGYGWAFDGINDYIEEAPAFETAVGTGEAALDAPGKMLAQRIKPRQVERPVFLVAFYLKKVGNPSGNLVAELRNDSSSGPGSTVIATSTVRILTGIGSASWHGLFAFSPPAGLDLDKTYWLILRWQDPASTTADAANYVSWIYDSAGAYGEPRAVYDGTAWTVTSGQSHTFALWADHLYLPEWTYIVAAKPLVVIDAYSLVFSHSANLTRGVMINRAEAGTTPWRLMNGIDGVSNIVDVRRNRVWDRFVVAAMSWSQAASTNKFSAYFNGQFVGGVNGTAGAASNPAAYSLHIGAHRHYFGRGPFFLGHIGGLIIARVPLTPQQIANVTRHLLSLRRYGVAGV